MSDNENDGVETVFNENRTRCLRAVPMGLAAYVGTPSRVLPGQWRGERVGFFDDAEAACSWLEAGDPKPKPVPSA